MVQEGLIKTVPIRKAMILLDRYIKRISPETISYMESHINSITGLSTANEGFTSILLKVYPDQSFIDNIDKILVMINNLGYYISLVNGDKYTPQVLKNTLTHAMLNDSEIYIIIEQKYDIELDRSSLGDTLYHITSPAVVDKILRIGLTPKTRSKIANHPGRIYLTNDLKTIKSLADKFDDFLHGNGTVILKIDISKISPKAKFYRDPNFTTDAAADTGFYTYTNIPPNAISVLRQMEV